MMKDAVSFPVDAHAALADVEATSYWFNHRNNVIASIVRRWLPHGTIIDVGGGTGVVSDHLGRLGFKCCVLEPTPDGAQLARARGLHVLETTFDSFEAPFGTIAACAFFDVIEHISDPQPALTKAFEVLRPSGFIYVTVPAHPSLWSSEDNSAGHYRRYTANTIRQQLTRAGFVVRYSSYFFGFLVVPVALFRTLPTLLGFANSNSATLARGHRVPSPPVRWLMNKSFAHELAMISSGHALSFGTSIVTVAQKNSS